MRRSTEFDATVRYGMRTAQPDLVVHVRRSGDGDEGSAPLVGLIIDSPVDVAVDRHRVVRRLRHVARTMLDDFQASDRVVIRALPGSRTASSTRLEQPLRRALRRAFLSAGAGR